MRYWTLIAPICFLALPEMTLAADCQPAFVGGDQAVVIDGVEIEPGGRAIENFQVRVQNGAGTGGGSPGSSSTVDATPCNATIQVSRLAGGSTAPDFPGYALRAPGNQQIEILPDPAAGGTPDSDVVVANAPSGPQGRAVPFQIGVPTQWGLRAGTYVDQLQLSLIGPDGGIVDRTTLTVTIVIPSAVALRLVGAIVGDGEAGPAQVDLGNLSSTRETRSQPFAARIFSTAPYVVRFSSANLGNLLHEQGREQVPYRLYFEGAAVELAGANEFPYLDRTPQAGDTRRMSIVVPPVVALAGRYSDRITITVMAL